MISGPRLSVNGSSEMFQALGPEFRKYPSKRIVRNEVQRSKREYRELSGSCWYIEGVVSKVCGGEVGRRRGRKKWKNVKFWTLPKRLEKKKRWGLAIDRAKEEEVFPLLGVWRGGGWAYISGTLCPLFDVDNKDK